MGDGSLDASPEGAAWNLPEYLRQAVDQGRRALVTEILGSYLKDAASSLQAAEVACAAGEWETVARQVHRLAGGALSAGANALAGMANAAEAAARAADQDQVQSLLAQAGGRFSGDRLLIEEWLRSGPGRER